MLNIPWIEKLFMQPNLFYVRSKTLPQPVSLPTTSVFRGILRSFPTNYFLDKNKCPFSEKFFHFISNFFNDLIQRKNIKNTYYSFLFQLPQLVVVCIIFILLIEPVSLLREGGEEVLSPTGATWPRGRTRTTLSRPAFGLVPDTEGGFGTGGGTKGTCGKGGAFGTVGVLGNVRALGTAGALGTVRAFGSVDRSRRKSALFL